MLFHSGFQVKVLEGPGRGQVVPLDCKEVTLGRAQNPGDRAHGHIFLYEDTVSRLHAQLLWDDELGTYVLHHRSQTNPTVVNGQVVEEARPLHHEDVLELGKVMLQIQRVERRWSAQGLDDARMQAEAPAEASRYGRVSLPTPTEPKKTGRAISLGPRPGATRTSYSVKVSEGPNAGQVFDLGGTCVIGRELEGASPGGIRLNDDTLRAEHARLNWEAPDQRYTLTPVVGDAVVGRIIETAQWTTVVPNGGRVGLEPGDTFTVGRSTLRLAAVEEPVPAEEEEEEDEEPASARAEGPEAVSLEPAARSLERASQAEQAAEEQPAESAAQGPPLEQQASQAEAPTPPPALLTEDSQEVG